MRLFCVILLEIAWLAGPTTTQAHHGHSEVTYQVSEPIEIKDGQTQLLLSLVDHHTKKLTAARFSLSVDGHSYIPARLGRHGLHFRSIHHGRKEDTVVTYARGTGKVAVPLSPNAKRGVVYVAKGLAYFPEAVPFEVSGQGTKVTVEIRRWSEIQQEGWVPADTHVHYDRSDPEHNRDWLTMLAADGLTHAHFLVLKGGNLPGVWAKQYAYGEKGETSDGERLIRPGEEYRDPEQGHVNLFGIHDIIEPISTGGSGRPAIPFNYPPLYEVLQKTRKAGGIGGPAHGGGGGRHSTAVLDTILGAVDFIEIGNTPEHKFDTWYQLMNCGFVLPPTAGTDLPNFSVRDVWQPFFGEIRMYVHLGKMRGYGPWVKALKRGEVFVSSGPIIKFSINGIGPGGTVRLPAGGGELELEAELASPRKLQVLEIIKNGTVVASVVRYVKRGNIYRIRLQRKIRIARSSWLAARGSGLRKQMLEKHFSHEEDTLAHTGAVRVLVEDQPITSPDDARLLLERLTEQREFYSRDAQYEQAEHRIRYLKLFDEAISKMSQTLLGE